MRCSKCGSDNPSDKKFCGDCGMPLSNRCRKCGVVNPPGKRFCGDCGAELSTKQTARSPASSPSAPDIAITAEWAGASSAIDGERKTVTALFADINGSMDLLEDLDPEEARAILDPALKLMIDGVHRYGGYIVQSTGDGIFALFGAPQAYEDHAQRALYAALRIQEEMRRLSARMREAGHLPFEARVGVNTGEVVVRSIRTDEAHAEYTPIGHSISLAARMQALAPVGSTAATEETRKLCEGYFIFKSLGPARVKGVNHLVTVYEVTGLGTLRTRLQRAAGRGLTKFVGRQCEIDALKHAAGQAQAGHGQVVAVMAEPGVGKSRLLYEFKATARLGWMVLEAFSVSHGKASAYLPVLEMLSHYFDISRDDEDRKRRELILGKVLGLDRTLDDTLPYLYLLYGIAGASDSLAQMDAQIRLRRTLEAIKRIMLRESVNQPVMVIFEDLHWIDEQTQEFLNLLVDSIGTARILLLVNYRTEYSHQWNSKTYYTQLRLDPLAHESADEMLDALLGENPKLIPLKRLIIEKTEGTPFFMEEMVQALFEEGALYRNGVVGLTRPLTQIRVPASVQAVLASRIDRLPADEKDLLQILTVLGREFQLGVVERVADVPGDDLSRLLARLQSGEFIYEQPTAGDIEYTFKHALTQEVAYNSVLIKRRKILHERAGQALESMFAEHLDDHLGELARHYYCSDNIDKAVEYLGRAGRQFIKRSALADAISSFTRAIDLLQKLPEGAKRIQREVRLQLGLGQALWAVRGYSAPEAEQAFARAYMLCEQLGDPQSFRAPCTDSGWRITCAANSGLRTSWPSACCGGRKPRRNLRSLYRLTRP
jgi:class 3 adenylate cyclase